MIQLSSWTSIKNCIFTFIPSNPPPFVSIIIFFFNDTATTEIYTLSLHDALPISCCPPSAPPFASKPGRDWVRSEKHTSELQSHLNLLCRLLLEKKKYG